MGVIIYDMMVMIKRRAWRLDAMIMKKLQRAPSHETNLLESTLQTLYVCAKQYKQLSRETEF